MTIQGNAKEVANFIEKWYKENLPLIKLKRLWKTTVKNIKSLVVLLTLLHSET